MEVHGEDPDCPHHGEETAWAINNTMPHDWQQRVMDLRAERDALSAQLAITRPTPTDSAALATEADGWRNIASAPQDGTPVLVYSDHYGGRITTARWDDDKYAKRPKPRFISSEAVYGRAAFLDTPPTHWRPLPAGPKATGQDQ